MALLAIAGPFGEQRKGHLQVPSRSPQFATHVSVIESTAQAQLAINLRTETRWQL